MSIKWKTLIFRGALCISAEIVLTCLGLDDLADYSEYLYDRKVYMQIS